MNTESSRPPHPALLPLDVAEMLQSQAAIDEYLLMAVEAGDPAYLAVAQETARRATELMGQGGSLNHPSDAPFERD